MELTVQEYIKEAFREKDKVTSENWRRRSRKMRRRKKEGK